MTVVWKYKVEPELEFVVQIPQKAKFLYVHEQDANVISMWFEVNPTEPLEDRKFSTVATGEKFNSFNGNHLGTFLMKNGLVFHLYEVLS